MTSKELYNELKSEAKRYTGETTTLYVSEMTSSYLREKAKKIAENKIEDIKLDAELGIIAQEQALKEIEIENLILRSL